MDSRVRGTQREVVSEINGVIYQVSVHYAPEGETVMDKLTRLIRQEVQTEENKKN